MPLNDEFRDNVKDEERHKFDPYAHAITTITEPHRLIHDGMVYVVEDKDDGILDNGVLEHLIRVPVGVWPHLHKLAIVAGDGDITSEIFEAPTTTADGTLDSAINHNRASTRTAQVGVYHGPTVTADGTLIDLHWLPPSASGTGNSAASVSLSEGVEFVLKPETDYLWRVTNNSGGTINIWSEIMWYELDYAR